MLRTTPALRLSSATRPQVQPGRNPNIAKAFAKVGDLQYYTAPAFLSGFEYSADDHPDMLWSLRWFNDYEMGHVAHFPKSLISFVPTRVLFTMIPELKGGLGAEYPVGLSFSTKEDIEKAIGYNKGNAAYDRACPLAIERSSAAQACGCGAAAQSASCVHLTTCGMCSMRLAEHFWEDVIGPVPEMGKGFKGPSYGTMER